MTNAIAAVRRYGAAVGTLTGWRRIVCAILLGGLATGALPPVHMLPFLLPALVGLIWLIDGTPTVRSAFFVGWWFGLGHFVTGLYWISIALLTDAEKFGWLIPFAVGGIAAAMAVFPGLAAATTRLAGNRGVGRILIFAAAWAGAEWLRLYALSGFPWNLLGTVWAFSDAMIQVAALIGLLGLGFLTALLFALPAVFCDRADTGGRVDLRWVAPALALAGLAVAWGYGALRLSTAAETVVDGVTLRIVQPNVAQHHKWHESEREEIFARHLRLSASPGGERVTHVIWPETAVPYFLSRSPERRAALSRIVPPAGVLLTGAPRTTPVPTRPFKIWNSLYAVDGDGALRAAYDKHHLVPFGEYVPLRWLLRPLGLEKLTHGAVDFSRGPGARSLSLPGLPPVSPLICYEVIFPGAVVPDGDRPGWLLNVTNDAWFGISSGPYQHFAAARFRAVEEGLPLVRAANTGISAVVDAYGRINAKLGLGEQGVLDAALPTPAPSLTLFARFGNGVVGGLVVLSAIAGVLLMQLQRQRSFSRGR